MDNITSEEGFERSALSLVIEAWKFARFFRDIIPKLGAEDQARCERRCSWFCRKLDEIADDMGLRIIDIVPGTDYDPGMAVTPINIDDFDAGDSLQVSTMIEPVIMTGDSVVRTGTVILRRP